MLYIVPTPIGNLQDITLRAINLFKTCQTIICEDSRQTRKLVQLLEIENKPKYIDITNNHSLNYHKIEQELEALLETQKQLDTGSKTTLLVSDAGMPGISDPGFEILQLAIAKGLKFEVLPGANALLPAVVASGLVSKEFVFLGFLPTKKGRLTAWKKIQTSHYPVVLYESVHRLEKILTEMTLYLDTNQEICICKDISKLHENIWRGEVSDLPSFTPVLKGEFVIVIKNYSL